MEGRIILIALGILIFISVLFNELFVNFGLIKFFFGVVFVAFGVPFYKKKSAGTLGNLIFGAILILDSFRLLPSPLNFWQIVLLMIASYILAAGLSGLFHVRKKPRKKINKEILIFDLPPTPDFKGDSLDLFTEVDWSYLTVESSKIETPLKVKASIDGEIYSFKKDYDVDKVTVYNKLKVSNVKVPRRAKISIYLKDSIKYSYVGKLSVSDCFLNFRQNNIKDVRIEATASKVTIIPSEADNSTIDINSEVSSINIKLPNNVALVLNQIGELNFKDLEWMIQRDDGSYVSANFSEALYTCYLNISSEMSKLNIEFID